MSNTVQTAAPVTYDHRLAVRVDVGPRARGRVLHPGQSFYLGTDHSCDLVLRDSGVSPRHCGLRHRGSAVELWDCSKDGSVHFAGARVVRALLPLDGCFEIGRAKVRMSVVSSRTRELLVGMVGRSAAMQELARVIRRAAKLDVPVMLRGESGSGKELAARAVHALSRRAEGPFVVINGASLNDSLAASALFGHVRGAYTGAMEARQGAFRQADGGTLFIDEVGAIPLPTQALLLRTLEDLVVRPVGGDACHPVHVRVVTATCEDLEAAVEQGRFRGDLYQRIATCVVRVPPLRRRRDDIDELAARALDDALPGARLASGATLALGNYAFPGNVRELKNIVLQAALHCVDGVIRSQDLKRVLSYRNAREEDVAPASEMDVLDMLEQCGGNVSKAARLAQLPRSTFRDRVRRARGLPPRLCA